MPSFVDNTGFVMVFGASVPPTSSHALQSPDPFLRFHLIAGGRQPWPFHPNTSIHPGSGSCRYAHSLQRNAVRRLSSLSPFASFRSCGHSACSMFRHSLRSLISPSSFASSQHPLFALPHISIGIRSRSLASFPVFLPAPQLPNHLVLCTKSCLS